METLTKLNCNYTDNVITCSGANTTNSTSPISELTLSSLTLSALNLFKEIIKKKET